ncbi:Uma2 family endonuclease [Streptomyces sp. S.PNR 29]|uniref:Uma2 family endonuclease n=1 Tax=Streptomyces sp. S.PNR 29 TaxID=2973805 RepID=UPI0025B1C0E7|nr:Uma2 family endonuclease [Streptomyces sp. S.PNR 29]MDN0198236.1 Uma2 family endonuclease [Streptomyces sp. S.PNR 29]
MTLMAERPTISGTEPRGFEELLDDLDELIVPAGYKAEIIKGSIVLSPWSKGYYLRVMRLVCQQLEPYLPESHVLDRAPALYLFPGDERAYGPDIHVTHERTLETTANRLDGQGLLFVAELTSPSTRDDDLSDKVTVYGRAGIPVYLILDMQEQQATVLWTPSEKGYESRCTRPFGEKLPIPEPFDCTLDTAEFTSP